MRTAHRAWTRTADAVTEPVTLDAAKLHLREDSTELAVEEEVGGLITAARQFVEERCSRSLITQTWRLVLDEFPCGADPIRVPRPPLISVTSITYLDGNSASQTWAASNYRVDSTSEPGRITLAAGAMYPLVQDVAGAVTIAYQAGYGAASAVPMAIKQAMKLVMGHWYTHREAVVIGTISKEIELAVDALLAPYRVIGWD